MARPSKREVDYYRHIVESAYISQAQMELLRKEWSCRIAAKEKAHLDSDAEEEEDTPGLEAFD